MGFVLWVQQDLVLYVLDSHTTFDIISHIARPLPQLVRSEC